MAHVCIKIKPMSKLIRRNNCRLCIADNLRRSFTASFMRPEVDKSDNSLLKLMKTQKRATFYPVKHFSL